jgi:hypothetical protein
MFTNVLPLELREVYELQEHAINLLSKIYSHNSKTLCGKEGRKFVEIFDIYTQFIAVGIENFTCKRLRRGIDITMTRKTRSTYVHYCSSQLAPAFLGKLMGILTVKNVFCS